MNDFMKEAIKEAKIAANEGEVPVGAVVVSQGMIVARAHNLSEQNQTRVRHF